MTGKPHRPRRSKREKPPAYLWYARDALSDTAMLSMTNEVEGIYRRLLDHAWLEDGLPADLDRVAPLCRVGDDRAKFDVIWMQLSPLFPQGPDGRRRNPRQETERKKQQKRSRARQLAARARWEKEQALCTAIALQTLYTEPASIALALPDPDPDQQQEVQRAPTRARPARMVLPDERRRHLLAAVHKILDSGPPYVDAAGAPVIHEVTEELKIIARRLQVDWRYTRELDPFINAAIAVRGRRRVGGAR